MHPQSYICDLSPYQPGMPIEEVVRQYGLAAEDVVKLASNENPLGMSPAARRAIEDHLHEAHRYPEQYELLQALAAYHKIQPQQIVLGNGSNDVLDLIARTYLGPSREAVSSQYAFAIYQIVTQAAGGSSVIVPAAAYGHDLPGMLAAITPQTSVIWIANPNNPTGTFIPYDDIQSFIEQVPPEVLVVLDEAYYEYLPLGDQANTPAWLSDYPNLILVRTFSKIYGLAGLRIGYGMASADAADLLNRVRQPFNVGALSAAAATAALGHPGFVQRSYAANVAGREQLLDGLEQLELSCLPAHGNFVTFRVQQADEVHEQLLHKGVIVRPLTTYGMPDWLRVTVGLPEENQRFLKALQQII